MLIGIDALGNVINRDQENIFQGSNLANEVKVVSELSSNIEMKVQFLTPRYTTKEITLVSEGQVASGVNLWSGGIPIAVTQYYGMVKCQIKAYNGTQIIASGACDFEVKKGFEEELPPEPDPDVYLQIIQELVNVRAGLVNKVDISYANEGVSQVINNDENGLKLTKGDTSLEVQEDKVVYNGKEIATKEYSDTGIANHNVSGNAHQDIRTSIVDQISTHNQSSNSHQDIRTSITNQISDHNQSSSAHQDIRDMITDWTENVAKTNVDNNFSVPQSVNGERLATEEYVDINGGKIDKIKQNNVELEIIDKTVDIDAYTKQQADNKFALETDVADIESKIPSQASSSNQLADKEFVNSSIATATATFRGNYNVVTDLNLTSSATESEISTALVSEITTADNNDYCFVQIPTSTSTPTEIARIDRYKFDGTDWSYEYSLNNSGFTASQWAAINSGITDTLVGQITTNQNEITRIDNAKVEYTQNLWNYLSWSDIIDIAENGQPETVFSIGDTKTITLTTDEQIEVVIVGFNHDTISGTSKKAGITFAVKNGFNTRYQMNSTETSAGGWGATTLRGALNTTIYNTFPAEIRNAIKTVDKPYKVGFDMDVTIETAQDKLFTFSVSELSGFTAGNNESDGTGYSYFATSGNLIMKRGNTGIEWWTRTPYTSHEFWDGKYYAVTTSGGLGDMVTNVTYYDYVVAGFCI